MLDEIQHGQDVAERLSAEALVVDVDGFEGPLDMLLVMARTQKVDLRKISVLALAEQYLKFIETARDLRIELAADYLVMAAWLAFLKSRLLLPPDPEEEGPSGEELAAHLAFQLERLEAMRKAAARLIARDQLGRDFFARGEPEEVKKTRQTYYESSILDLMQAYARIKTRADFAPMELRKERVLTMEQALDRLRKLVGDVASWANLENFLPLEWRSKPKDRRSATAATFAAVLELAKAGQVELKQDQCFAPLLLRSKGDKNG